VKRGLAGRMSEGSTFIFGRFRVLVGRRELIADGRPVELGTRAFDLLLALVQRPGELVTKDELMHAVWGSTVVEENTLAVHLSALRKALGDGVDGARYIQTVPGRGYRFLASVTAESEVKATQSEAPPPAAPQPDRPLRGRGRLLVPALAATLITAVLITVLRWSPWHRTEGDVPPLRSVAVLPIQNLTGDPSLDLTADTLTEDVIFMLIHSGFYSVAPRNAVFALKGKPVDDHLLGRQLHVRHVVTASLRKLDSSYRVNLQLVDTVSGEIVGASDLGRTAPDGSFPERQLVSAVWNEIANKVNDRWTADQLAKPADDNDPENVLARFDKIVDEHRREDVAEGLRLLDRGRALRPDNYNFLADGCRYYSSLVASGYYKSAEQRAAWAEAGLNIAVHASEVRPEALDPHSCRSFIFTLLERWDDATAECRHVIDTFPMTNNGYESLANVEWARGWFRDALRDFTETASRVGDHHRELGTVHVFLHEYDAAIAEFREAAVEDPEDAWPPFFMTAAFELSGYHSEAVATGQLYLKLNPENSTWGLLQISHEPAFLAEARVIRDGLHKAGVDPPPGMVIAPQAAAETVPEPATPHQ